MRTLFTWVHLFDLRNKYTVEKALFVVKNRIHSAWWCTHMANHLRNFSIPWKQKYSLCDVLPLGDVTLEKSYCKGYASWVLQVMKAHPISPLSCLPKTGPTHNASWVTPWHSPSRLRVSASVMSIPSSITRRPLYWFCKSANSSCALLADLTAAITCRSPSSNCNKNSIIQGVLIRWIAIGSQLSR